MELAHLKTFVLAAELMSFTQAAKRQAYSQSAVSQQIRDLETAVGARLFERHSRSVDLTPAGEILRTYAMEILRGVDAANAALRDTLQGPQGVCRIGASSGIGGQALAPYLVELGGRYPGIRLRVEAGGDRELLNGLDDGELDLVVLEDEPPRAKVRGRVLRPGFEDRVIPVVGPGLAPRHGRPISALELGRLPLVAGMPGKPTWAKVERELVGLGIEPRDARVVMELGDIEATKRVVANDVGVGFVPASCCQRELADGTLVQLEVTGYRGTRTYAVLHGDTQVAASVAEALAPRRLHELVN